MNYCQNCGSAVNLSIPDGDNRVRYVCTHCGYIHYQNPKIVAGCLPVWENRVLLCKRAIEPRQGYWTLPAGFMENEETLEQAAARESIEEANASLENLRLYTVISLPHISQVYMMFLADLIDTEFHPGEESLETKLFAEEDIPWDTLAFKTIYFTLERFFEDRKKGVFPLHNSTITKKNH
ncbi:MAG: NUDIX hydrolase [Gammaproteobacteria bacterium]|nr:MAG: NUDIX hydrolase [Gammaproteobacteria bacterium]